MAVITAEMNGWVQRVLGLHVAPDVRVAPNKRKDDVPLGTDQAATDPPATGQSSTQPPVGQPAAPPPVPPVAPQPAPSRPGWQRVTQAATTRTPTAPVLASWDRQAPEEARIAAMIGNMQRWGDPTVATRATELQAVRTEVAAGRVLPAGQKLDALKLLVEPAHAAAAIRYAHQIAMAAMRPLLNAADAAERGFVSDTGLTAPRTAYTTAKAAAEVAVVPADTAATLATRRTTLATAANSLLDALPLTGAAADAVAKAVHTLSGPSRERADGVNPTTLAQAQRKQAYDDASMTGLAAARSKAKLAEDLLAQVAADAAAARVPDEMRYVQLREQQKRRLAYAATLTAAPEGSSDAVKQTFTAARAAFIAANTPWTTLDGALEMATGSDRFTTALQALSTAQVKADDLIQLETDAVTRKLGGIGKGLAKVFDSSKASNAAKLINATDPVVLNSMTGDQHTELLQALQASGEAKKSKPSRAYVTARVAIYKATKLDQGFLTFEEGKRREVIDELMKDKKVLQAARDEWPAMTEAKKLETLQKVVATHCAKMGFEAPAAVEFYEDPNDGPGTSGQCTSDRRIQINRKGYAVGDFELMMDTVFHENSHNWQIQLSQRLRGNRPPPIDPTDPIYRQALLFDLNENDYDTDKAYNEQPQEAHSFRAGPVSAKALMRALAE